jgi:predicted RNA-binding protein Jag
MENFLRSAFGLEDRSSMDAAAVREVEEAVDEALEIGQPVELSPQNNHLRRLQHELIQRSGLNSQSKGEEPYRRVVVYPGVE